MCTLFCSPLSPSPVQIVLNPLLTESCLETLPNELLFMIIGHLSSSDLVRAFSGLNHRFDVMVGQSTRHFIVSEPTSITRFDDYPTRIRNAIETLDFHPQISISSCSFPRLRSVVLRCSNFATVTLSVDCDSAQHAIHSCLDILRVCTILPADWNNEHWSSASEHSPESGEDTHVRLNRIMDKLSCPAIVRLSLHSCSEEALLSLCSLTPNLVSLNIKQLVCTDDGAHLHSIVALLPQSTCLQHLHITSTTHRLNDILWIDKLIDFYQSSLEHLTLEISLNNPVDGYSLQTLLERCRRLSKVTFAFSCSLEETDTIDVLRSFQSDWWLDSHRPPVLIFCSNHCETWIVSMPCHLDGYLWFPIEPEDWLMNKGRLDSADVAFVKQKCLRFTNSNRQPITLDLVHTIAHVFRTARQELSIPPGEFLSPDHLLQSLRARCGPPLLPLVYSLDLNASNLDQLDAKTLILWLLLAANARVLNICQGTTTAKIQLANRLKALLEEDTRLKSITQSIEEVHVFYMFDSLNYATKQRVCQMYSDIFRKPVIRR